MGNNIFVVIPIVVSVIMLLASKFIADRFVKVASGWRRPLNRIEAYLLVIIISIGLLLRGLYGFIK